MDTCSTLRIAHPLPKMTQVPVWYGSLAAEIVAMMRVRTQLRCSPSGHWYMKDAGCAAGAGTACRAEQATGKTMRSRAEIRSRCISPS